MDGYYIFSDECGQYQCQRTTKTIRAHPFYVRASVALKLSDYIALEQHIDEIKHQYDIAPTLEVKWAELGRRFKCHPSDEMKHIPDAALFAFVTDVLRFAVSLESMQVFFSVFDNSCTNYHARETVMLKMHIQNALQRIQHDMRQKEGFATFIIDDIGDAKNKSLKEICHSLMVDGDYVKYTNIKKSILVDYSNHCAGLQLADYCAGILTSCLKRIKLQSSDNYLFAYDMLTKIIYKRIRHDTRVPDFTTYRFGIDEVPNDCGKQICQTIASKIDDLLFTDFMDELSQ